MGKFLLRNSYFKVVCVHFQSGALVTCRAQAVSKERTVRQQLKLLTNEAFGVGFLGF